MIETTNETTKTKTTTDTKCSLNLSHMKAVLEEVSDPIKNWDELHQALEDTQSSLLNWDAIYDALGDIQIEISGSKSDLPGPTNTTIVKDNVSVPVEETTSTGGSEKTKKMMAGLGVGGCREDESGYRTDNEDNGDNGSAPMMMVRVGNTKTRTYSSLDRIYARRIIQNILSWIDRNSDNLPSTQLGWVNLIRSKLQKIEIPYDIGTLMHIVLHKPDIRVPDIMQPLLKRVKKFMKRHEIDNEEAISQHLDVYQRYLGPRCKLTIWIDPEVIVELLYRMHILSDVNKVEWSRSQQRFVSKKRCRSSIEEIVEDGDEVFKSSLKHAVREVNSNKRQRRSLLAVSE